MRTFSRIRIVFCILLVSILFPVVSSLRIVAVVIEEQISNKNGSHIVVVG